MGRDLAHEEQQQRNGPADRGGESASRQARRGKASLFEFSGDTATKLRSMPEARSWFGQWVLVDGYFYGNNGNHYEHRGEFRCIDPSTGETRWSVDLGAGQLIAAGDKLILLNEKGHLKVAAADPSGYQEFSAGELRRHLYYAPPVLVGQRLDVRNYKGDLYCIDMR